MSEKAQVNKLIYFKSLWTLYDPLSYEVMGTAAY